MVNNHLAKSTFCFNNSCLILLLKCFFINIFCVCMVWVYLECVYLRRYLLDQCTFQRTMLWNVYQSKSTFFENS